MSKKKSLVGWAWVEKNEPLLKWRRHPFGLTVYTPYISKKRPKVSKKVRITIEEIKCQQ